MARFRPRRRSSSPVSTRRQNRLRRFRSLFPRFSPLARLRGMDVLGFFGGARRRRLNTTYGLPSLGRRFSLVEALEPRQMLAANVEFSVANASDLEDSGGNIPMLLVNGTTTGGSVQIGFVSGTAPGADYTLVSPVNIPAGTYDGTTATAIPLTSNIIINADTDIEPDEFFTVGLFGPVGDVAIGNANGTSGIQSQHTYTILNDDNTVEITPADFAATDPTELEGSNRIRIQVESGQLQVVNDNNDTLIASYSAVGLDSVNATGEDGDDDTLIIDSSVFAAGIDVNYDAQAFGPLESDSLEIDVDGFTNVHYIFDDPAAPPADFSGMILVGGSVVTFEDIEPITQSGTASNVRFDLTSGADQALLEDVGSGNLRLTSSNGLFEQVTFAAPSNVIDIRSLGGNDIITVDDSVFNSPGTRSFHGRIEVRTGGGANDEIHLDLAGSSTQGIDLELFGNLSDKVVVPDGSGGHDVLTIDGGSIVGLTGLTIDDTADSNDDPAIAISDSGSSLRLDGVTILSDDDGVAMVDPVMIAINSPEPDVDLTGNGTNTGTNTFEFVGATQGPVIFVKSTVASPVLATDLEENNLVVTAFEDQPITIGLVSDGRTITSASANNGDVTINGNGTVTYQTDINFEGATDTLTYTLNSGGLFQDNPNATGTVTINIDPQNDPPVNSLPPMFMMNEDGGSLVLSSPTLGVTDADSDTDDISVTLSVTAGTLTVNNAAAPGVSVTPAPSGPSVTLTGTVAEINAILQDIDNDPMNPDPIGLIFTPPAGFNGDVTLTMHSDDLGHNPNVPGAMTDTDISIITVKAVNDAPVNQLGASPIGMGNNTISGFQEDVADQAVSGLSVLDDADENNGTIVVTLSVDHGTLEVNADADNGLTNTTTVGGQGSATVTLTGAYDDVNAVLATLTYTPAANFNGNDTLTISTNDNGNTGLGGPMSDTDDVTLVVAGLNDGPTNLWNGQSFQSLADPTPMVMTDEDVALAINQISVTDPDAGTAAILVTLSVNDGTLNATASGGAVIGGGGSGTLTITGSQADVNATLASLVYTPDAHFEGNDTLQVVTNDQGNSGSGGPISDTDSVEILVKGVNDPPVILVDSPDSQSVNEDNMLIFNDVNNNRIRITDPNDPNPNHPFEVTLSVTNGILNLSGTTGITIVSGANGSSTMTISGNRNPINNALNGLKFTPNADFFGVAQLSITANDLGHSGSGGPLTDFEQIDIAVNPVNDAPVNLYNGISFNNLGSQMPPVDPDETTDENTPIVFSSANGNQLSTSDVDANAGSTDMMVTVSVISGSGTLSFGSTAGLDSMTLVNNASTISAKGTLAEINNALEGLTFTPNPTFMGGNYTTPLTLTVNDQGNFGLGGPMSDSDSLDISVTEVNDPPSFDLLGTIIRNEDTGAHSVPNFVTNISAGPGEDGTQTVTVSVVSFSNSGLFAVPPSLTGSGTTRDLSFTLAPDAFGTSVVTVTATDNGSPNLSTSKQFLIIVNPINDAPVITLPSSPSINEDTMITFTGGGMSPNPIVISDDSGDAASPQDIQVDLSVEFGKLTLSSISGLTSVSGNGTGHITLVGTEPNIQAALNSGLTYMPNQDHNSTRDGSGNGDRLSIAVEDFGHAGGQQINPMGPDATAVLPITINPVNDPVVLDNPFPDLSRVENAPTDVIDLGTNLILGSNFFDDADKNDNPPDNITIMVSSSNPTLVTATLAGSNLELDYQPNQFGSATITVKATDSGGVMAQDTFIVTVGALNDPPTITHVDQDTTMGNPGNDALATEDTPLTFTGAELISLADPDDANLTVTLEVQHGTLALNSPAGSLTVVGNGSDSIAVSGPWVDINAALNGMVYTPDANFNGVDPLVITATDGLPQTTSLTVEINVAAVNDAPTANADTATVMEDSVDNQLQVRLNDVPGPQDEIDAGQTIKIVGLSDANGGLAGFQTTQGGTIEIGPTVAQGLFVEYTPAPDFYGTDTFQYLIQDNLGATSVFGTVTVTVTPKNDAPIVTASSSATTAEDTPLTLGSGALNIEVRDDSPTGQSTSSASQVIVNLTALNGTFNISAQGGVSVGSTAGGVTLLGTVADINATLDASQYVPNLHFNTTNLGSETITVTVDDQGNIGGGTPLTDSASINLTVTSVNDPPVLTFTPNPVQVNQNTGGPQMISGFVSNRSPGGGADEAGQSVTITGTSEQSDPNNVVSGVSIDNSNGKLTFTVNPGVVGTAVIQVTSVDSGGPSGEPPAMNTQTFEIQVGRNLEPLFTLVGNHPSPMNSGDVLVDEDSDLNVITGWLQELFAGPADDFPTTQSIQSISINVLTGAGLFMPAGLPGLTNLVLPAPGEDPPGGGGSGDLVFTLQDNVTGTATLRITVVDNGGTANGGDNTRTADFKIEVQGVNDPPSFSLPSSVHSSLEDQGPIVANNFVTNISPGLGEGSQTVSFTVTPQPGNPAGLFSSAPSITSGGTLTYQAAPDANGIAFFNVVAVDSEGGMSAPQGFAIVVTPVNDEPTATFTPNPVSVDQDSGPQTIAGHTVVDAGAADESGQTVTLAILGNDNTGLFSSQPTLVNVGGNTYDLEFESAAGASGVANVTVLLTDDGGTSNGGDNTATATFQIVINSTADAVVEDRHIFYKNSAHDPSPNVLNALDGSAIDSSKDALLPNNAGSFVNTTGYNRGINGIMIDVTDLTNPNAAALADDLSFRTGNTNDTSTWTPLNPALVEGITVHALDADTHRITVGFVDGSITDTWLEVRLAASSDTGLGSEDVHYWGNVAGNTGNDTFPGVADVAGGDLQGIAQNINPLPTSLVDNRFDLNKDRKVDGGDLQIISQNVNPFALFYITPNGALGSAAAGVDLAAGDEGLGGETFSGGNEAADDGRVGDTSEDDSRDDAFASIDGEGGSIDDDLLDLLAGGLAGDDLMG